MNIIRAIAIPAAAIMLLSGCMGQHLSTGETPRDNFIQTGEVKVVPITPELLANAAASQAAQVPPELLAYKPQSYQIQPGDTLLVTVWDHPELSTPAGTQQQAVANGRQVQPDGTFFFPYAGKNNIAGKTIEQVRSMPLHQALRRHREKIRTILPRHEQGGGFAAQGVSRTSNDVGLCM